MLLRRDRAMTAIGIVLDVAFHAGRSGSANAAEIAERLGQARRGIEPVLQALARAGLLASVRGPHGGYRLGRAQRDLSLAEIVGAAVDGSGPGAPAQDRLQAAVTVPLWDELDQLCQRHLAALTVDDLLRRAAAAGITRPTNEPLNFTI